MNSPSLFNQKAELMIEQALMLQSKEHQNEIENLEASIFKLEAELRTLELNGINPTISQRDKEAILADLEKNLNFQEKDFARRLEEERMKKRDMMSIKIKEIIENEEKKPLPLEEEQQIYQYFHSLLLENCNKQKKEEESLFSQQKKLFEEELIKFYKQKKQEHKEKLDGFLLKEKELWEEEKKNLQNENDLQEIGINLAILDEEINVFY